MSPDSWSRVAREVEAQVGPLARPWLAAVLSVEDPEGVLAIRVPSAFVRNALRERCWGALQKAAREAGFSGVELRIAPPSLPGSPSGSQGRPGFPGFRVAPGNQLAYAAVSSMARRLRSELHPLVLFGPPGCGKSHLLRALSDSARTHGIRPVLFTSVPRLASRIALSAKEGRLPAFRASFRSVRLMILDAGERLKGKTKTQTELVQALDALGSEGGVLVLAMRDPPARTEGLSDPLQSRLQGGLVVGIEI